MIIMAVGIDLSENESHERLMAKKCGQIEGTWKTTDRSVLIKKQTRSKSLTSRHLVKPYGCAHC
jgi:hypothetical protein